MGDLAPVEFSTKKEKTIAVFWCVLFVLVYISSFTFTFWSVLFLIFGDGAMEWYHVANFALSGVLLAVLLYATRIGGCSE